MSTIRNVKLVWPFGISRWETVVHEVYQKPARYCMTGVVLASGRIFGEAAALIDTAGDNPLQPLTGQTGTFSIWKRTKNEVYTNLDKVTVGGEPIKHPNS